MEKLPERKPPRLGGFDYSQNGTYFVTVCTAGKQKILGQVVGGGVLDAPFVRLSEYGAIVQQTLLEIGTYYQDLAIDKFVIMPNHVHLLLSVGACNGSSRTPTPTNARLPAFISTWKRFTNKKVGFPLWPRSYYDHIIRSEQDYLRVWQYLDENPAKWSEDEYFSSEPETFIPERRNFHVRKNVSHSVQVVNELDCHRIRQ